MTGRGGGGGRRVLLPPINFIFKLLQQQSTVQVWLYEQLSIRIEGTIRVRRCAVFLFVDYLSWEGCEGDEQLRANNMEI